MQDGYIAIPGSHNEKHIQKNFDFELTPDEMEQIASLDKMSAWAIGKGDTMKRFLIFISSIMVLAFTACGNSSSAEIVSEGETRTSNNKDIQTEPAVPANSTQQNTLQADDTAQSEKIEGALSLA